MLMLGECDATTESKAEPIYSRGAQASGESHVYVAHIRTGKRAPDSSVRTRRGRRSRDLRRKMQAREGCKEASPSTRPSRAGITARHAGRREASPRACASWPAADLGALVPAAD